MVELLIARKKDKNLTFRVIKNKTGHWGPEEFGKTTGGASDFEMVIRERDYNLIAYLLFDLNRLGYPIEKAVARFNELLNKPDLFFLS